MAATTKKLKRVYDAGGTLTHKECRKCGEVLAVSEFYTSGKRSQNNIDGYANICKQDWKARWHQQAKKDGARVRWLLSRIKTKCKKHDIPFDLTLEDLVIPERCPILDIPLKFGVKTPSQFRDKRGSVVVPDDSPSVDRIIPERGYVRGNIIVVSYRANNIKSNATPQELVKLAEFYKKFC